MFVPRPHVRAVSLVRTAGGEFVVRLVTAGGDRMASRLRPLTLRDALDHGRLRRIR